MWEGVSVSGRTTSRHAGPPEASLSSGFRGTRMRAGVGRWLELGRSLVTGKTLERHSWWSLPTCCFAALARHIQHDTQHIPGHPGDLPPAWHKASTACGTFEAMDAQDLDGAFLAPFLQYAARAAVLSCRLSNLTGATVRPADIQGWQV